MVEADSHLKLLHPSILDIYKVTEHIDMLFIGIWQQPYTVIPTLLGSNFEVWGHMWSQTDVITSCLRLTATSNCIVHLYWTYKKCLSTLLCCPQAQGSSLTQLYTLLGSDFGVLGCIWSQSIVIMSWLRLTATSNCFLNLYWRYTKYLSTLIYCLLALAQGSIFTQLFTLRGSDF